MLKKNLFQQLYLSYLLIIFIALGAIGGYTVSTFREFHFQQTVADLESKARLVEQQILPEFSEDNASKLQTLCKILGDSASIRITLMLEDGRVVGDSHEDPLRMDNHINRPEVRQALVRGVGLSRRSSSTLQSDQVYVAIPVRKEGKLLGVVRTALPLTILDRTMKALIWKIILAGLIIAVVAAFIGWVISRRISQPLSIMRESAVQFARGKLESRIQVQGPDDIVGLAEALNQMALQLDERFRTIIRQGQEQKAILSSMVEGVFAVDSAEKVISLNQAAARLLEVSPDHACGRSIPEVVRNTQLQEFIQRVLKGEDALEEDIAFFQNEEERSLQVVGAALHDAQSARSGAVVVLNDVTRLRRLETMRRDFVANVSHELKTPITSIKGFVETLLDGAMENPDDTRRFLEIMAKQSDRLNAIIEDLLSLSRIEQEAEKQGVVVEDSHLKSVLQAAIMDCQPKAASKKVQVSLQCDPEIKLPLNAALIEQAVANLVDNAVKYSEEGQTVLVETELEEKFIILAVSDQGQGIPKEHLSRLFERFYRVDKARSRKLGGTGLGLAIVKHIAQAHGGDVSVKSQLGIGSTFKIHLPLPSK